jgi:hypothetical protein
MTDEQFAQHARLLREIKTELVFVFWQITVVGITLVVILNQMLKKLP